jgi:hypothetical protein
VKVIGLIADIVESSAIPNRKDFQRDLGKILGSVTASARAAILSPYTITLGDEFQALYREPTGIFRDLVSILWQTHPTKIRFALSHDVLLTAINPDAAIGMDGPAFGAARKLLSSLKAINRTIVQIWTSGSFNADLVNASLKVLSNEIDGWNRTATGALFCLLNGHTVEEMGGLLGVKERTIYKAIRTHHIRDHASLLRAIESQLAAEADARHAN